MEILEFFFDGTSLPSPGVAGLARDLSSPHMLVTYVGVLMLLVARAGPRSPNPSQDRCITCAFGCVAAREIIAFASRASRAWFDVPFPPPIVMLIEEWTPGIVSLIVLVAFLRYLGSAPRPTRAYGLTIAGLMLAAGALALATTPGPNWRQSPRIAAAEAPCSPVRYGPRLQAGATGPAHQARLGQPSRRGGLLDGLRRWPIVFNSIGIISALWASVLIWRFVHKRARVVLLLGALGFLVRDLVWLLGWAFQTRFGPPASGPLAVGIHFMALSVLCYLLIRERAAEMNVKLESALSRLESANKLLHEKSIVDSLTGIANRRRFDEVLQIEWDRAARSRSTLSLAIVDIDHFKSVNDDFGHPVGDQTLQRIADALEAAARRGTDLVARYGGDEFAVLLPATSASDAAALLETVRAHVADTAKAVPPYGGVTVSVGIAEFAPHTGGAPADLVAQADAALYESKEAGRNQVTACDPSLVRVLAEPESAWA